MKVQKKTEDYDFEAYLLLPTISINRPIVTLDGREQKRTFLGFNCFFSLTTKHEYFIIEIALIIGIGIKLRLREN